MNTVHEDQRPPAEAKGLVVFDIVRDSKCSECSQELLKGAFLFMEGEHPLCLECADLDHLVYLPRGDTALTRRARKHSVLSAVVLRFSRARRRYERQGVLVEESALQRAEEECYADVEERRARREQDKVRRVEQDHNFAARVTDSIQRLFPGCPPRRPGLSLRTRRCVAVAGWGGPPRGVRCRKRQFVLR